MSDPHDEPLVTGEDRADELEAAWFERLLDVPDADGVPAAYEPLAAVLLTLRAPGNEDVSGEAAAVTMFRSCQAGVTWVGINRTRTAKALTVAAAVTLATVTGAAAAGRLPADIQDMTSHLLDKVGIHIPAADRTHDKDAPKQRLATGGGPRPRDGVTRVERISSRAPHATRSGHDRARPDIRHPRDGGNPAGRRRARCSNDDHRGHACRGHRRDNRRCGRPGAPARGSTPGRDVGTGPGREPGRGANRRPTDHPTRQRPRLAARRPTDHPTRQRPRLAARRPTDHPTRQRPRLAARRPTDHPTRQRPRLPARRRAGQLGSMTIPPLGGHLVEEESMSNRKGPRGRPSK